MKKNFMFTSESVTEGHPDKLCDIISDAIVDEFLRADPHSRVIAESAVSAGVLFLATRFASEARLDIPAIARRVVNHAGYHRNSFNAEDATIFTSFQELTEEFCESPIDEVLEDNDIDRVLACNQATVFGYACNQTRTLMPLPIQLAHALAQQLSNVRTDSRLRYLAPDGQSQVGIEYRDRKPHRIHSLSLVASQQTGDQPDLDTLRRDLREQVIEPVFAGERLRPDNETKIWINAFGPVVEGGPTLHAGLTGRKNAVDTYGGFSRHSGAALSGKDPTRIDRIGAYAARHAAKNIVAADLAEECEVQLSYSIGMAQPVSVQVETFATGRVDDEELQRRLLAHLDFHIGSIIRRFELREQPARFRDGFYRRLASYGHVGREDLPLPWEQTDIAEQLKEG